MKTLAKSPMFIRVMEILAINEFSEQRYAHFSERKCFNFILQADKYKIRAPLRQPFMNECSVSTLP